MKMTPMSVGKREEGKTQAGTRRDRGGGLSGLRGRREELSEIRGGPPQRQPCTLR